MLGQNLNPVSMAEVFQAREVIRKNVAATPLVSLETLNLEIGGRVYLKLENLLPAGAYKYRGALNKISSLMKEYGNDIKIITASSGNHGMACALAASSLGIEAVVVVPTVTPQIKKDCISSLGARLVEAGETYDGSFIEACRIAEEDHLYYVHPVADQKVLGGQGTIALELAEQLPDIDQIVVPLGGGGLISGISYTMKQIKPSVKIWGVMPEGSDVYVKSRKAGKLVELEQAASMADAVVRKTGESYLFPYIEQYVDELCTVSEQSLMQAIRTAAMYGKVTLEGAGALPLAAVLEGKCKLTDHTVLICSGGNIDRDLFLRCLG